MLGLLTASALLASDMPRAFAWPLAGAALADGLWLARRELRRPVRQWMLPSSGAPTLDGEAMADLDVRWRGPFAFLAWRTPDGRARRLAWWPDTLPAPRRRELRLALEARRARTGREPQAARSMAP